MTRSERERLIERYFRGEMSPTEEQDFFIEVAADKELRVDLKAYQTVDAALQKDRDADRATYTELRARLQKTLAETARPATSAGIGGNVQVIVISAVSLILVATAFLMKPWEKNESIVPVEPPAAVERSVDPDGEINGPAHPGAVPPTVDMHDAPAAETEPTGHPEMSRSGGVVRSSDQTAPQPDSEQSTAVSNAPARQRTAPQASATDVQPSDGGRTRDAGTQQSDSVAKNHSVTENPSSEDATDSSDMVRVRVEIAPPKEE